MTCPNKQQSAAFEAGPPPKGGCTHFPVESLKGLILLAAFCLTVPLGLHPALAQSSPEQTSVLEFSPAAQIPQAVRKPAALPAEQLQANHSPASNTDENTNPSPQKTSVSPELRAPQSGPHFRRPPMAEDQTKQLFEEVLSELLPLTPEQIKEFRREIERRSDALGFPPPKKLVSRTESLPQGPIPEPPVVTLTPGLVTALIFTAHDGQPWPVNSCVLGNGGLFSTEIAKGAEHQLLVSPLSYLGNSNVLVSLKDLDQPIMIRLEISGGLNSEKTADGLVNFRLENSAAAAQNKENHNLPSPGQSIASDLLLGKKPPESIVLKSEPELSASAFYQNENGGPVYVKTNLNISWPQWHSKVVGPEGLAVYEIPPVKTLVMGNGDRLFQVNLPKVR